MLLQLQQLPSTPEETAAYVAQRKKNYPTQANVKKKACDSARQERGEDKEQAHEYEPFLLLSACLFFRRQIVRPGLHVGSCCLKTIIAFTHGDAEAWEEEEDEEKATSLVDKAEDVGEEEAGSRGRGWRGRGRGMRHDGLGSSWSSSRSAGII